MPPLTPVSIRSLIVRATTDHLRKGSERARPRDKTPIFSQARRKTAERSHHPWKTAQCWHPTAIEKAQKEMLKVLAHVVIFPVIIGIILVELAQGRL